jgi:hypothetical protein
LETLIFAWTNTTQIGWNWSLEWLLPQQLDLLQIEIRNPTAGEAGGPADEDPGTNAIGTFLQAATESNRCTVDETLVKLDHGSELGIAHHVGKCYVFQLVNGSEKRS